MAERARCPSCGIPLGLFTPRESLQHVNDCLDLAEAPATVADVGTAECGVCGLNLTQFTAYAREEHANRCADTLLPLPSRDGDAGGSAARVFARKPPPQKPPESRPEPDAALKSFLDALGLGRYAVTFAKEEIDLEALRLLSENDLAELRIPIAARKRIAVGLRSAHLLLKNVVAEKKHGNEEINDDSMEALPTQEFRESRVVKGVTRRETNLVTLAQGGSDDDDDDDFEFALSQSIVLSQAAREKEVARKENLTGEKDDDYDVNDDSDDDSCSRRSLSPASQSLSQHRVERKENLSALQRSKASVLSNDKEGEQDCLKIRQLPSKQVRLISEDVDKARGETHIGILEKELLDSSTKHNSNEAVVTPSRSYIDSQGKALSPVHIPQQWKHPRCANSKHNDGVDGSNNPLIVIQSQSEGDRMPSPRCLDTNDCQANLAVRTEISSPGAAVKDVASLEVWRSKALEAEHSRHKRALEAIEAHARRVRQRLTISKSPPLLTALSPCPGSPPQASCSSRSAPASPAVCSSPPPISTPPPPPACDDAIDLTLIETPEVLENVQKQRRRTPFSEMVKNNSERSNLDDKGSLSEDVDGTASDVEVPFVSRVAAAIEKRRGRSLVNPNDDERSLENVKKVITCETDSSQAKVAVATEGGGAGGGMDYVRAFMQREISIDACSAVRTSPQGVSGTDGDVAAGEKYAPDDNRDSAGNDNGDWRSGMERLRAAVQRDLSRDSCNSTVARPLSLRVVGARFACGGNVRDCSEQHAEQGNAAVSDGDSEELMDLTQSNVEVNSDVATRGAEVSLTKKKTTRGASKHFRKTQDSGNEGTALQREASSREVEGLASELEPATDTQGTSTQGRTSRLKRGARARVRACAADMRRALRADVALYDEVLTMESVQFDRILSSMRAFGLTVSQKSLAEFLHNEGIIYKMGASKRDSSTRYFVALSTAEMYSGTSAHSATYSR